MDQNICPNCGNVRNPKNIDRSRDLDNPRSEDDIPNNWLCPGCGVDKRGFVELKLNFE